MTDEFYFSEFLDKPAGVGCMSTVPEFSTKDAPNADRVHAKLLNPTFEDGSFSRH